MGVSKVEINRDGNIETLIDISNDTVTPESLDEGVTAHSGEGEPITGTRKTTTVLYTEQTLTEEQKIQARKNIDALGLYVGSGEMPDGCNIQIDPDDEADEFVTKKEFNQLSEQIADLKEAIPKVIQIVVGNEFKMYYKNVLSRCTDRLWLSNVSGITVKRYKDYLSITATEAVTKSINWKVYDEAFNVLGSGTIQVIATAEKSQTAKVLIIGDSTVTQSNAISQKLLDCFSSSGGSLTLLGTRGTSPALHEGRAGWSAKDYCTKASDSSYTNPFYNNGFDFSYYMTQQGYSGVDVVVIQLGINDIFSMTYENFTATATLGYIQQMVSSIVTYNSSIKIIVNLLSVPNGDGTSFTEKYGTSQIDFVNLTNSIRMSKALIDKFTDDSYVTISPNNCVLDSKTDINDGVHPNATGYAKLGQAIYETINGIFNGSESGGDEPTTLELWNVGSRTAVVKSYANTNDHRTISNNHYYYPCAYTGAWVNNYDLDGVEVGTDTLQFSSPQSAYGIFVPFLGLDPSKTYRFTVNPTVVGFRVYLVNYSSTGAYVNNELVVDKTTGLKTFDFVPNAEYQQGFCFACLSGTKNVVGKFINLSLQEVTT